ncbi:MAG: ribonuclease H-like YkuK family protein [Flavobacteriales bacterium]
MRNAEDSGIQKISFKIMHSGEDVDLLTHIESIKANCPEVKIHIGCDSQNYRLHTVYVTTVVFRYPRNGAHVIYLKERVPKIQDLWTKLWGELERSAELGLKIREEYGIAVEQIDLDYNADPSYPSHKLLSAASGYLSSLGFNAKAKPDLLMAVWAANSLCH